jgi:hypothetical protein
VTPPYELERVFSAERFTGEDRLLQ